MARSGCSPTEWTGRGLGQALLGVVAFVVVRGPFHMVMSLVRVLPDDAVVMPHWHDADRRAVLRPGGDVGRRGGQASGGEKADESPNQQTAKRSTHCASP